MTETTTENVVNDNHELAKEILKEGAKSAAQAVAAQVLFVGIMTASGFALKKFQARKSVKVQNPVVIEDK